MAVARFIDWRRSHDNQVSFSVYALTALRLLTNFSNIGNDVRPRSRRRLSEANPNQARALWNHYDDSASPVFIQKRQLRHVMLLSVFSCVGRLCSGIGSDLIVKKLHASRFWCLFVSASIFCVAQVCGTQIENPHLLGFVSGISGCEYPRITTWVDQAHVVQWPTASFLAFTHLWSPLRLALEVCRRTGVR